MANATVMIPFSSSTQGKAIKVVATSTAGTAIHSTGISATVIDRIYMWAENTQAAATASTVLVTVEFGDATAPDHNIVVPVSGQGGLQQIIDGQPLLGSGAAAATVGVFAATTAVIQIYGYVLRITP